MRLLWIFFVFPVIFYLQRHWYEKQWKKGLQARVKFLDDHVYEGDETGLSEEIVNEKPMPLPALEIRFALDLHLAYRRKDRENASVSDKNYRRDLFSMFGRQKTVRTFKILCQRRGYYRIDALEMTGHDFFFQKKYYQSAPQEAELYVYPRQADIRRIRLIARAISGARLTQNRIYQDPFAFAGIRAYDPADPMNRINWKASARSGELMVNQYDATTGVCVRCFLDVADRHILKYPQLAEESISIVTSLAAQLTTEQMELDVISNAQQVKTDDVSHSGPMEVSLKAGTDRLDELYRRLACIETDRISSSMRELLLQEAKKVKRQCLYLLVSHNQDGETVDGVKALAAAGADLLWVMPVQEESGAKGRLERNRYDSGRKISDLLPPDVRILRWEVE